MNHLSPRGATAGQRGSQIDWTSASSLRPTGDGEDAPDVRGRSSGGLREGRNARRPPDGRECRPGISLRPPHTEARGRANPRATAAHPLTLYNGQSLVCSPPVREADESAKKVAVISKSIVTFAGLRVDY